VKATVLGIIQGLTEFLPVSSSGHLYIIKRFLTFSQQSLLPFFVFLHIATLLAIIIYLRRQILSTLSKKNTLLHLGIITVITAVIGLTINAFFTGFFENKLMVAGFLFINGGILLTIKNLTLGRNCDSITIKDSLLLGLLQGLAVFPGISRSGITITGLLRKGFKPQEAFTLSFLMAIPITLGAFLLKAKELANLKMPPMDMAGGFLAAFISGFLALILVKKMLTSQRFSFFGYYCILLSLVSLIL